MSQNLYPHVLSGENLESFYWFQLGLGKGETTLASPLSLWIGTAITRVYQVANLQPLEGPMVLSTRAFPLGQWQKAIWQPTYVEQPQKTTFIGHYQLDVRAAAHDLFGEKCFEFS